jgi:hypothetical protein
MNFGCSTKNTSFSSGLTDGSSGKGAIVRKPCDQRFGRKHGPSRKPPIACVSPLPLRKPSKIKALCVGRLPRHVCKNYLYNYLWPDYKTNPISTHCKPRTMAGTPGWRPAEFFRSNVDAREQMRKSDLVGSEFLRLAVLL